MHLTLLMLWSPTTITFMKMCLGFQSSLMQVKMKFIDWIVELLQLVMFSLNQMTQHYCQNLYLLMMKKLSNHHLWLILSRWMIMKLKHHCQSQILNQRLMLTTIFPFYCSIYRNLQSNNQHIDLQQNIVFLSRNKE